MHLNRKDKKVRLESMNTDILVDASNDFDTAWPRGRVQIADSRLWRRNQPVPVLGDEIDLEGLAAELRRNGLFVWRAGIEKQHPCALITCEGTYFIREKYQEAKRKLDPLISPHGFF